MTPSTILIIDDTPANLHLLASILMEKGYEVRAVVSGAMGLIAARTVIPDLILLDIKMPGMDGYEVCQELKADATLRDIPVIFISSLEDTLDKVTAFQVGGVDYITKPFQVAEVVARVESQLARYHVYQQAQEIAALKERQRLARDLHDAVSQTLFSVSVMAETLLFQHQREPAHIEPSLQQIHQLSQAALAEMRILLFELRPDALLNVRLGDLLKNLANALAGRSEAEVRLTITQDAPLPADVQVAFYRIAQEALNNIVKHAHATQITILLHNQADALQLQIKDNGCGFAQASIPAGHFGLTSMRERAESVGAIIQINSIQGTTITVDWKTNGDPSHHRG